MYPFHEPPHQYPKVISLNVLDLERSIRFYEEIIGCKVLEKNERKVLLSADGKHPLISLEKGLYPERNTGRNAGLYHVALLLPKRADLSRFLRHLMDYGIRFGASDHGATKALYLEDVEGNGIEVYWDRPVKQWIRSGKVVAMPTTQLDLQSLFDESTDQWTGLPKETKIGHIHLQVSRLDEAEEFYIKGLGFDLMSRLHGALFMSTGGYHHHIACNVWYDVQSKKINETTLGLHWFSLAIPDEKRQEELMKQLQSIGAQVYEKDDHIWTVDPSGNHIRIDLENDPQD